MLVTDIDGTPVPEVPKEQELEVDVVNVVVQLLTVELALNVV